MMVWPYAQPETVPSSSSSVKPRRMASTSPAAMPVQVPVERQHLLDDAAQLVEVVEVVAGRETFGGDRAEPGDRVGLVAHRGEGEGAAAGKRLAGLAPVDDLVEPFGDGLVRHGRRGEPRDGRDLASHREHLAGGDADPGLFGEPEHAHVVDRGDGLRLVEADEWPEHVRMAPEVADEPGGVTLGEAAGDLGVGALECPVGSSGGDDEAGRVVEAVAEHLGEPGGLAGVVERRERGERMGGGLAGLEGLAAEVERVGVPGPGPVDQPRGHGVQAGVLVEAEAAGEVPADGDLAATDDRQGLLGFLGVDPVVDLQRGVGEAGIVTVDAGELLGDRVDPVAGLMGDEHPVEVLVVAEQFEGLAAVFGVDVPLAFGGGVPGTFPVVDVVVEQGAEAAVGAGRVVPFVVVERPVEVAGDRLDRLVALERALERRLHPVLRDGLERVRVDVLLEPGDLFERGVRGLEDVFGADVRGRSGDSGHSAERPAEQALAATAGAVPADVAPVALLLSRHRLPEGPLGVAVEVAEELAAGPAFDEALHLQDPFGELVGGDDAPGDGGEHGRIVGEARIERGEDADPVVHVGRRGAGEVPAGWRRIRVGADRVGAIPVGLGVEDLAERHVSRLARRPGGRAPRTPGHRSGRTGSRTGPTTWPGACR